MSQNNGMICNFKTINDKIAQLYSLIRSGGDYPLEIKMSDPEMDYWTYVQAEFNKWYYVINSDGSIIKLPEVPEDGKVRNFCVTLENRSDEPPIMFVPANRDDYIFEQEDADYRDEAFYELNFACMHVVLSSPDGRIGKEPFECNLWFVTSTKFDFNPTEVPQDFLDYLELLIGSENSSSIDPSTPNTPGPVIIDVEPGGKP